MQHIKSILIGWKETNEIYLTFNKVFWGTFSNRKVDWKLGLEQGHIVYRIALKLIFLIMEVPSQTYVSTQPKCILLVSICTLCQNKILKPTWINCWPCFIDWGYLHTTSCLVIDSELVVYGYPHSTTWGQARANIWFIWAIHQQVEAKPWILSKDVVLAVQY